MRVLVDTSVWVSFLREGNRGTARALDELLERREVVMCGPVAAELVAGTVARQLDELWRLLAGLPWANLERPHWHQIGDTAARLRWQGASVALTDLEIAVAALNADAALWSYDRDFDRIRSVLTALERFEP